MIQNKVVDRFDIVGCNELTSYGGGGMVAVLVEFLVMVLMFFCLLFASALVVIAMSYFAEVKNIYLSTVGQIVCLITFPTILLYLLCRFGA